MHRTNDATEMKRSVMEVEAVGRYGVVRSRFQTTKLDTRFLVAMRLGETPVPIPNTKVKTQAADDTALETVWESRWLPDYN